MAIIMFEGFDHWIAAGGFTIYTNSTNSILGTAGGFSWGPNNVSILAGTLGGKKLSYGGGVTSTADFTSISSFVMGFRYTNAGPNASQPVMTFLDNTNTTNFTIGLSTTGKLVVYRGSTAGTLLGTGTTSLVANAEYMLEFKFTNISNAADVEVRLSGVTEITLTGVDVTNTAVNSVSRLSMGSNNFTVDDMYMFDLTGSAPYNDFLGNASGSFQPWRVETLFPSSNNSVQFTPNASTNVSRVQETATDSDTTYNSDSTAGHIDTFNHGSLGSTPSTVFAVKTNVVARKEDITNRTLRTKMISGGTTSNGTTYNLSTVYQTYEDIYLVNPDTGTPAWNSTSVNATKIGYELVA